MSQLSKDITNMDFVFFLYIILFFVEGTIATVLCLKADILIYLVTFVFIAIQIGILTYTLVIKGK